LVRLLAFCGFTTAPPPLLFYLILLM